MGSTKDSETDAGLYESTDVGIRLAPALRQARRKTLKKARSFTSEEAIAGRNEGGKMTTLLLAGCQVLTFLEALKRLEHELGVAGNVRWGVGVGKKGIDDGFRVALPMATNEEVTAEALIGGRGG